MAKDFILLNLLSKRERFTKNVLELLLTTIKLQHLLNLIL